MQIETVYGRVTVMRSGAIFLQAICLILINFSLPRFTYACALCGGENDNFFLTPEEQKKLAERPRRAFIVIKEMIDSDVRAKVLSVLNKKEGVGDIKFDENSRTIEIIYNPKLTLPDQIGLWLSQSGYTVLGST